MIESEPKGTFGCPVGHISGGSELKKGGIFGKCPWIGCYRDVSKISSMPAWLFVRNNGQPGIVLKPYQIAVWP